MYVCVFTFAFFIFMYIKNVVIVVLVVVVVGIVVFFSSYLVLFLFMLSHFRLCALGLYIHLLRSWPRFADVDIHTNSYIYTQKHTHILMHTCVPPLKSVGDTVWERHWHRNLRIHYTTTTVIWCSWLTYPSSSSPPPHSSNRFSHMI